MAVHAELVLSLLPWTLSVELPPSEARPASRPPEPMASRGHQSSDSFWKESLERDHNRYVARGGGQTRRADEAPELRLKFLCPKTTYQDWTGPAARTYQPKALIPDEKQHWRALEERMLERREPHNIFNVSDDTAMKLKMQRLRAQISHERELRQQADEELKSRRTHEAQELRLYQRTVRGLRLSPRLTLELQAELEAEELALHRSRRTPRRSQPV